MCFGLLFLFGFFSFLFPSMSTETSHSLQPSCGSAWLPQAEKFPITLFNSIFQLRFFPPLHMDRV